MLTAALFGLHHPYLLVGTLSQSCPSLAVASSWDYGKKQSGHTQKQPPCPGLEADRARQQPQAPTVWC